MPEAPSLTVFAPTLLAGKTALVTGGGSGLGRAIAWALAAAGADLLLAARRTDRLETAAREIADATERRVEPAFVNIREREAVEALGETADRLYGGIDILVNNAGGQFPQPARDFKPKGWHAVIDTNLNGTWHMTQVFGRRMLEGSGGAICQIIAVVGRGFPGIAHSAAARAGVLELARTLAYEWGPKVRVNCVAPGPVRTAGFDATYDAETVDMLVGSRIPRPVSAEAVAHAVVFLSSQAAEYINGEVLYVADGQQCHGRNQALLDHDFEI
ncbi:MAG: SDR family oxidoreductase [Myxococcota bacterium]